YLPCLQQSIVAFRRFLAQYLRLREHEGGTEGETVIQPAMTGEMKNVCLSALLPDSGLGGLDSQTQSCLFAKYLSNAFDFLAGIREGGQAQSTALQSKPIMVLTARLCRNLLVGTGGIQRIAQSQ